MHKQPSETESEFQSAEHELRSLNAAQTHALELIQRMSAAFSEHAVAIRELDQENRHLTSRAEARSAQAERGLEKIRRAATARADIAASAVAALRDLLPTAKTQAKKGKPALLRMILRASR